MPASERVGACPSRAAALRRRRSQGHAIPRVPLLGSGSRSTIARLGRLIVNAAVSGGVERWRTRLQALPEKKAESLAEFAIPLLEELSSWPKQATWGEWLERIESLIQRYIYDRRAIVELLDELAPLSDIG